MKDGIFFLARARSGGGIGEHEPAWLEPAEALSELSEESHRWALRRALDRIGASGAGAERGARRRR